MDVASDLTLLVHDDMSAVWVYALGVHEFPYGVCNASCLFAVQQLNPPMLHQLVRRLYAVHNWPVCDCESMSKHGPFAWTMQADPWCAYVCVLCAL